MNSKLFSVFFALLICSPVWGFYDMPIQTVDYNRELVAETRLKETGRLLTTEKIKVTKNDKYVILDARSAGETEDNKPTKSREVDYFSIDGSKVSVYSTDYSSEKSGKPWLVYKVSFDWDKKIAYSYFKDFEKNKVYEKAIKLTDKTLPSRCLSPYMSYMISNKITDDKIKLIIATGDTFGMNIKIDYTPENITVNGKTRKSCHVRLKPDLGILTNLIPYIDFWFDSEPPYHFLKFVGLEKGPGSPTVIQEVVSD